MHFDAHAPAATIDDGRPWFRELTRYHWFVLAVSALGWMFDCLDQQLFNLARGPAIAELYRGSASDRQFYGGLATTVFMLGWASGGLIFGIMGDRLGRAKTMVLTILVYSLFTGLSAASVGFWDFALWRFLTGLGVGGEFAVGVALVAEVMPDRARPHALGWLQALSAVGNVTAAFVGLALAPLEAAGALGEWKPWRYMFLVGAIPALLALLIRRRLKEPERWVQLRASKDPNQRLGSIRELFGNARWRRNAIVGLVLATSGVVGLWGIGFFGFDLVRSVFRQTFVEKSRDNGEGNHDAAIALLVSRDPAARDEAATRPLAPNELVDPDSRSFYIHAMDLSERSNFRIVTPLEQRVWDNLHWSPDRAGRLRDAAAASGMATDATALIDHIKDRTKQLEGDLTYWSSIYGLLFNVGAFFGIYSFSKITHRIGRRGAFLITFVLALVSTAFTFWFLREFTDVYWMVPIMGFCQIALFGGYAIYFPELFPTRLRSTGTSFCYNVGRYLAASGPLMLGSLAKWVFGEYGEIMSWRYAGVTMCSFFLLGLLALPFAPETRGKPLPE